MAYEEKSYEDIVTDITNYILSNTDKINDLNVGSIIRTMIEAYSYELSSDDVNSLYKQLTEVYNGTKIDLATGYDLNQLGELVGVVRKQGVASSNNVTFARTTPAGANFTINAGTIVSTQPVQGQDNIRFTVNETTTFNKQINSEQHTFYDGVYNYPLTQRLINSVVSISGTQGSAPFSPVLNTDYVITAFDDEVILTNTIIDVDNCDSLTGWTNTTDTPSATLDTVDFKEGTASINLGKTGTTTTTFGLYKTIASPVDITAKKLALHFKFDSTLSSALSRIEIRIGSSASDYIVWSILPSELEDGWNFLKLNTDNASFIGGPLFDSLDYIYIGGETLLTSDTITSGDLKFDFIILTETESYRGDLIEFITRLDDDTSFFVSYIPLSVEVTVTAEDTGTAYNVASNKIVYKVSEIPNIVNINNYNAFTNGEDEETDTVYRNRIKASSTVGGKATVDAMTADILALEYIKSVSIDDMPLKQEIDELITFETGTDEYQLQYEVVQGDLSSTVTGYEDELNGAIDNSQTTITLADASSFPTSGKVIIENEVITYSGKSTNDLTGCTRGTNGTTAVSHLDTTVVKHWFAPDTDYSFDENSKIVFLGIDNPQDTEELKVTYYYRWLGHITIYVFGFNPLTTAQLTDLNDKITNEFKAAGVWYELSTPVTEPVSVTANIHILPGYVFETVKANTINAIRERINDYAIGEDVRLSQLYDIIQDVLGVDYSQITSPASDVVIASDKIASAGTIIVNEY